MDLIPTGLFELSHSSYYKYASKYMTHSIILLKDYNMIAFFKFPII